MKQFWLFIIIFIFSLIQSAFLPINFVCLFVISLSIIKDPKSGAFWAFLAGIILDLCFGGTLGLSSIAFLIICFLGNLYKGKFLVRNLIYLTVFSYIGLFIYNTVTGTILSNILFMLNPLFIIAVFPFFEILDGYLSRATAGRLGI